MLRRVRVVEREVLSPRMLRLTFEGEGLEAMGDRGPAASVRLLVPEPGSDELVLPKWNGNEFLSADGSRPLLRTFTPLRVDRDAGRLDLEIVRHPGGAVSSWAGRCAVGSPAAISGPGAGHDLDVEATRYLILGDETALPAMGQLLGALPASIAAEVHVEVADEAAVTMLGPDGRASVRWHVNADQNRPGAALVSRITAMTQLDSGTHLFAAGEAAAMQAIRKHLFAALGLDRSLATIRGYWSRAR